MTNGDELSAYSRDLVYLLRERGADAARLQASSTGDDAMFQSGRALAYVEVLSLMQHQADAFMLNATELGLVGFDPEVADQLAPPVPKPRSL
jgi:hypothetical protein